MVNVVYNKYISLARELVRNGAYPHRCGAVYAIEYDRLATEKGEDGKYSCPHLTVGAYANSDIEYDNSLFLYYPRPQHVFNKPDYYGKLRVMQSSCKGAQREELGKYFPIPTVGESPYVIRGLRHHGGKQFYIAENDNERAFIEKQLKGNCYTASWWGYGEEDIKEYRIVFVKGEPVIRILKKWDNEKELAPRNHEHGARFYTIRGDKQPYLFVRTDFRERADNFFNDYPFSIAAIDVAMNMETSEYVVFEINLAPGMEITKNVKEIYDAAKRVLKV